MFYAASKLLWTLADPLNLALIGVFVGAALARRRDALVCATFLIVAGFSPAGALGLRTLEDRFAPPPANAAAPYGIVVLGGAIDEAVGDARGQVVLRDGASRLTEAALLAKRFPQARVLYTGGSGDKSRESDEAEQARRLLVGLGVAADRIAIESKSRNTDENAKFSAALVGVDAAKTWWVVTSAYHMPRSMGLFRQAGFSAVAYPVDYYTFGDSRDFHFLSRAAEGLRFSEIAMHEWTGLAAYWATGRIASPFPAQ